MLCDRGYSHREGVAQVLGAGTDVVVRLNKGAFPLTDEAGKTLDLLKLVGNLKVSQLGEWPVWFEHAGARHKLRLCVLRKSLAATRLAQRKAEESAREKGHQVQPETLKLAAFVLVLTSLPATWGTALVLEHQCVADAAEPATSVAPGQPHRRSADGKSSATTAPITATQETRSPLG